MQSKNRRCGYCRKKVLTGDAIVGNLKAFCSYGCLNDYMRSDRGQKAVQKEIKKETEQRKAKLKTRSEWLREAQTAFNAFVRIRDQHKPCISCGSFSSQKVGGTRDCGHYLSRGAHPELRFRLDNVASQCVRCNRYLSGNVANFRIGLIERWGRERVERLEQFDLFMPRKFSVEYLKRVKRIFNKRARLYGKLRSND